MWRAGSPQGYQPPDISAAHAASQRSDWHQQDIIPFGQRHAVPDSPFHQGSRLNLPFRSHGDQGGDGRGHSFPRAESHSADSTRPGTPPSTATASRSHNCYADPHYGYQQLLEPLLPISGQSPAQQPASHQQSSRLDQPDFRARSLPFMPAIPALSSPLQRPPSHHSHSPQPSEPSNATLQGLNVPLEPHERQLLNNLLHRSQSTRSQDRASDHSQSSTSTHHDSQPLSLPRTWSARRLTTGSLMMHDTGDLQDPQDLSRQAHALCH